MRPFQRFYAVVAIVLAELLWLASCKPFEASGATNQAPVPPAPPDRTLVATIYSNAAAQARLQSAPTKTNAAMLAAIVNTNQQSIAWFAVTNLPGVTNVGYKAVIFDGTRSQTNVTPTNAITWSGLALHHVYFFTITSLNVYLEAAKDGRSGSIVTNETLFGSGSFILPFGEPVMDVSGGQTRVMFGSSSNAARLYAADRLPIWFLAEDGQSNTVVTHIEPSTNRTRFFKLRPN